MAEKKTSTELVEMIVKLDNEKNSAYGWGCWGHLCTRDYIDDKAKDYPSHYTEAKKENMYALADKGDGWIFDCCGLIKAFMWGWTGDFTDPKNLGGARYKSNDFPDTTASGVMLRCNDVSTDFSKIAVGEMVYKTGHIGVYLGNGLVGECTPDGRSGVQISRMLNTDWNVSRTISRKWLKHGKLRDLDYEIKTGSLVEFVGDSVGFTQSGSTTRQVKPGLVRVTQVFHGNGDRPYHIMFEKLGTSNASGYVKESEIR